MENLKKLNKYFVKYKWLLLSGFLFVGLSNFFRAKMPQAIRNALDLVLDSSQCYKEYKGTVYGDEQYDIISSGIGKYALYVMLFATLMGIFMYFMRQTVVVMSRLIEYDLRKELFIHYEALDYGFFKNNRIGDLMARLSEDVSKVRMYVGPGILYGMNLLTLFIVVIYAMIRVNPTLALYTLLPLPLLSYSIYLVSNLIKVKSEEIQKQLASLNSIAQEVYSGIRIVKSYVSSGRFSAMFKDENDIYKSKSMELARINALFYPLMILLISISTLTTVIVGAWQVAEGKATAGNIAEFVIYVNMLTWPVTALGWITSIIQQAEASQKRLNEILDIEPKIISPIDGKSVSEYGVAFDQVNFTYQNTGVQAINNLSFELAAGQKMVILGKTASGKTTIADLLLRMYDVDSGNVSIGGVPIQELDLNDLRKQIAYVPQDLFLFSDTVHENIGFGVEVFTRADAMEYAQYASVHDDIMNLPDQYDTLVGERGVTLSGGQKQRISIARALLKKPNIVILDDCLSAVDTDTEHRILNYLNDNLKDKTVILITHRINNLMDFDKIIVLDEGKLVEEGDHDTLMKLGGIYFEMYQRQNTIAEAV